VWHGENHAADHGGSNGELYCRPSGSRTGGAQNELTNPRQKCQCWSSALVVLLFESSPGAEEKGFYRRLAHVKLFGDGGIAHALDLTQHQHALVALRQLAHRLNDRLVFLGDLYPVLWRLGEELDRHGLVVRHSHSALLAAVRIDGEIARNAEQPAAEGRIRLEAADTRHGPRQRFLAHILGVLAVPGQVVAEPKQRVAMTLHEQVKSALVTAAKIAQELGVAYGVPVLCNFYASVHTLPMQGDRLVVPTLDAIIPSPSGQTNQPKSTG
jgi:hypothetical protein